MIYLANLLNVWAFHLFALFFGFAYGGWALMFPAITGKFFGVGHMGTTFGFIAVAPGIGGALGPLLAGYIFDPTGSYSSAFLIGTGVALTATLLIPVLKTPNFHILNKHRGAMNK
jgi:MFS family permease